MSSKEQRQKKYIRKLVGAVSVTAVAAALIGSSQDARSAVFEQTYSGKVVVIRGGAPAGAPSRPAGQAGNMPAPAEFSFTAPAPSASGHEEGAAPIASTLVVTSDTAGVEREDVPTDGSVAPPPLPSPATPSVGMLQDADAISRQFGARLTALRLPTPRTLSANLSDRQRAMRALAADVARRHSRTSGVRTAGLDQATFVKLFTTLIHRESNFNERAVSPVGAKGLGQLMPSTARELGVRNAFSAEENLEGSAIYLTAMLERFGSAELALAAYNAGPNAVEKYEGIPPYRETRQYVSDIFAEVGREPHPSFAEIPAPAAQPPKTAGLAANPFALVDPASAGRNPQGPDKDAPVLLAFAPTPATMQNAASGRDRAMPMAGPASGAPANGQEGVTVSAVASSPVASSPQQAANADEHPVPIPTPAPRDAAKEQERTAVPDLDPLPAPREFVGTLTSSQETMRDLAADTALRHAQDPGVANAQLSAEAFTALFVAMIRRESSFNPRAVSSKGAQGLGQLSPATARALGVKNVFSAEQNLDGSARLLADLLGQFHSPALALAAYSAGPRAVVRSGGRMPDDAELRQHVADVLYDAASDALRDFVAARRGPVAGAIQAGLPPQHAPAIRPAPVAVPVQPGQDARLGSIEGPSSGPGRSGIFAIVAICGTFAVAGLSGIFARRSASRNRPAAGSSPGASVAVSDAGGNPSSTAQVMPFPSRPQPGAKAVEAAVSAGASA